MTQEPAKPLNIYQRLNEVRKKVAYVQKDKRVGRVDEGGYLVVTHDAVTSLVRDHFIEQGIVIVPSLISSAMVATGTTTKNGVPYFRYEAKYGFDVVNADNPDALGDKIHLEIEAHAMDHGDKAPGKALSYAKKYVVLKLLEIESGETEEEREQQKPREKVTPNAGAGEGLTAKEIQMVLDTAIIVKDALNEGKDWDAYQAYVTITDNDQKLYMWAQLNSKERAAIKRMGEAEKKGEHAKT